MTFYSRALPLMIAATIFASPAFAQGVDPSTAMANDPAVQSVKKAPDIMSAHAAYKAALLQLTPEQLGQLEDMGTQISKAVSPAADIQAVTVVTEACIQKDPVMQAHAQTYETQLANWQKQRKPAEDAAFAGLLQWADGVTAIDRTVLTNELQANIKVMKVVMEAFSKAAAKAVMPDSCARVRQMIAAPDATPPAQ